MRLQNRYRRRLETTGRPARVGAYPRALARLVGASLVLAASCPAAGSPSAEYASLVGVSDLGEGDRNRMRLPENPVLEDYLRSAALHNTGLRAKYFEWIAASERVPQAQALPDPTASYAYYIQAVETRVGAQRQRLGIAQMFPWLGKRALRGDVAAAAADEKRAGFEAAKFHLFFRVTEAYTEYYYLARSIEITKENIELLRYWEKLAQAKYQVSTGSHTDLVKVQVELGKLTDQLRTLEELRGPMVARLNATLDRPSDLKLPWPTRLAQTTSSVDEGVLTPDLAKTSPELRALDAAITREARSIALAKKDFYPDVTLGLQWIETASRSVDNLRDNGQDAVIGSVSVNLPVWRNKYHSGVREAEARRAAASEHRIDREHELSSSLALAAYKVRDADRKANLYGHGLIQKAKESLAATSTAYESGEADFLDLLDAQRILLDFRLSHQRALVDREQHLAASEMLVGHSLRETAETDSKEIER